MLNRESIRQIFPIMMKTVFAQMEEAGYHTVLSKELIKFITNCGYNPLLGARPLRRAITKFIESPVAAFIIDNNIEKNSTLELAIGEDGETLITLVR